MTLHTCNKAPASAAPLELCLRTLTPDDALLLLEDGVYALLEPAWNAGSGSLYALAADLAARGISDKIPPAVNVIDYREFVALCLEHERIVNWT